ncbi:MAG: DUF2971 domain-containing protein [Flavobacteriales bacterium]|nr:DUF2971 domain-containing protein [Flavobacteriales bacterium]
MKQGKGIEDELYEALKKSLLKKSSGKTKFVIDREVPFSFIGTDSSDFWSRKFDILITKGTDAYAVIEVKSPKSYNQGKNNFNAQAIDISKNSFFRFIIFTDGVRFSLFDGDNFFKEEELNYNEVLKAITSEHPKSLIKSRIKAAISIFKECWEEVQSEYGIGFEHISDDFLKHIQYNESGYFSFSGKSGDLDSFENRLFQKMLPRFSDSWVYRYTTLDTLFSTLTFNSYRMFGLVGMNDRTEINYVDNYLHNDRLIKPFETSHYKTVESANKRYISSCTNENNEDNLTMWRLYADDSKGVSLKFRVHSDRQNSKLLLKPVYYAREDKISPPLEVLKRFLTRFRNEESATFKFQTLNTWKHFFKPYEYSIEEEVRLLYIENLDIKHKDKGWVITSGIDILNPYVDFKLNDDLFPIELREITLGPNCPDKRLNKVQIEELIRQKKREKEIDDKGKPTSISKYSLEKLKVKLSNIESYRIP